MKLKSKGEPVNLVTLCIRCYDQMHDNLLYVNNQSGFLSMAREAKQAKIAERRARVRSLTGEGMTQSQIAGELSVSEATVKRDLRALNGSVPK